LSGDGSVCSSRSSCISKGAAIFNAWIVTNTAIGALAFVLVYIFCTVLFIPGSLLTIGAGVAFGSALGLGPGTAVGVVVVWLGASIGSISAFMVGRYLLKDWVKGKMNQYATLMAVYSAFETQGLKITFLCRLSPIIPFAVFNYIMGITGVTFRSYVIGTIIGILPGTTAYVFIGAALGVATTNGRLECKPDTTLQTTLLVVGGIATFLVVLLISYYAKKELNAIIAKQESEKKTVEQSSLVE
jgi:uncharacterized membrane protein YdjX (TVP38/TMEM64 family)